MGVIWEVTMCIFEAMGWFFAVTGVIAEVRGVAVTTGVSAMFRDML